jgi:hypothetical protein
LTPNHPVPVLLSCVPGIAATANTSIVEKQVYAPQGFHGFIPDLAQLSLHRHVSNNGQYLVVRCGLQLGSCLLQYRFFDVRHHHVHTFGNALFGKRLTDTACRTSNHRDLSREVLHEIPPQKALSIAGTA